MGSGARTVTHRQGLGWGLQQDSRAHPTALEEYSELLLDRRLSEKQQEAQLMKRRKRKRVALYNDWLSQSGVSRSHRVG